VTGHRAGNLDPRAWVLWAFAASLPAMLGRNPWPLIATLAAVSVVRLAWSQRMPGGSHWSLFVRLAIVFALIGILFNVLTVRSGDQVIARIPEALPLVGGELTLNAAVYGVLGGLALVLLVLVGTTVSALLDWTAIVRLLPPGLTTMAVAGSVAFTLLPQTAIAFREIREAQMARGHRIRGARDFLPIIVPMLGGGLERAITLSEALESRGFGASTHAGRRSSSWIRYGAAIALGLGALSAFALASGRTGLGVAAIVLAVLLLAPAVVSGRSATVARTRYRSTEWLPRDTAVAVASAIALVGTLLTLQITPDALRYEPYPNLSMPRVDIPLLAAVLSLLMPALVAPTPVRADEEQP
jgi:energy-coupling factor transport system permease protein